MVRPHTVAASEVGVTDGWWTITAYPDGWVDTPVPGVDLAQTRRNGLEAGRLLLAFAALVAFGFGLSTLDLPSWLRSVASVVLALGLLAWLVVAIMTRYRWTGERVTRWGRTRPRPPRVAHRPGAPSFRRASTARELASWLDGARLTTADQVRSVVVDKAGSEYRAHVVLVDGTERTYTSPSARLAGVLGAYATPLSAHAPGTVEPSRQDGPPTDRPIEDDPVA